MWADTSTTPTYLKHWTGTVWTQIATLNTGALANSDAADWASQVTGVGKPADNADVTVDAINAGIVTTGNLELSTGGSVHTTGKTSATDGNPGVYLGDVSGDKQFYVGDGDKKSLSFHNGQFEIGQGVRVVGISNPYNPDITEGRAIIQTSDYVATDLSSGRITFTIPTGAYTGQIKMTSLHALDGYVIKRGIPFSTSLNLSLANPSWANPIIWVAAFKPDVALAGLIVDATIGIVANSGSSITNGIGFRFKDGNVYGVSGYGSTSTPGAYTELLLDSQDGNPHRYLFDYDGSSSIGFYIDGVLKGTITANLPSGADNIADLYRLSVYASTANASTVYFTIGSWQIWIRGE